MNKPIIDVSIPGYSLREKPDYQEIGKKIQNNDGGVSTGDFKFKNLRNKSDAVLGFIKII